MATLAIVGAILAVMLGIQHLGRYRGGKGPDSKGSC